MFAFPPNFNKLFSRLKQQPQNQKAMFELKFNESRGIARPFITNVLYDKTLDIPSAMKFLRFEREADLGKALICQHTCAQNMKVRFFIKYVPKGIKPFSLRLTICPDCGAPVAYQFIVYPGDLNKYPKMRDVRKFENPDELPRAKMSPEYKIGVA